MAKKTGFLMCLVLLVLLCIISVVQMYNSDNTYQLAFKTDNLFKEEVDLSDTVKVQRANIELEKEVDIEVGALSEEVLNIFALEKGDICYIEKGQTVPKNTKLFRISGKDYNSTSKMKCINIEDKKDVKYVSVLDYSKLRIITSFPVDKVNDELYEEKFEFKFGNKKVTGVVDYIDYVCNEGYVKVYCSFDSEVDDLMYGMKGTYTHTLDSVENALALPLAYIIYDEYRDLYYVELVVENYTIRQEVDIGIIGNKFAEILSGLEEEDTVKYPESAISLWEYLNER